MSFVCTLSNDPCAAIHVLHLSRWILVRLVGHFCSRTRGYPRDYNMSITCGLVWLLLETCCQPNGLTHQCGLFAPSVDSRPCSSTRWQLDVANHLVARLHHLNLVRWSCDSIASSTWLSTSSSVWFSTAFSSSFCWFSSANWSHQHQLLFDTTLQLGNYPSPSSWWRCTALISSLISVCRAKASSCSLPLTLSGNVLAHLPPSSSSPHFSQTPHQNPDKSDFNFSSSSHALARRIVTKTAFPRIAALSRTPIFSLPSQIHVIGLLLALLGTALSSRIFGFRPWLFFSSRILGVRPWLFFFKSSLKLAPLTATRNLCRPRFVTTLDMHCLILKFLTILDTR